jgi:hypothetical protein
VAIGGWRNSDPSRRRMTGNGWRGAFVASSLWLTDQDADIQPATGVYKRAVLGGRGDNPSLVRAVTNTAAGPTAGIQLTRTAGASGTALAWLTDPLSAVTLTAAAWTAHLWMKESDAAANVAPRVVVTTFAAGTTVLDDMGAVTELTTTTADIAAATEAATAVSISDGDRLLLRIYADDAASSMAADHTVTLSYGGTYPRAEGDSYLTTATNDNLTLTAELPDATATSVRRVLREEQATAIEPPVIVRDEEIASAFTRALTEYTRHRPRVVVAPMSGDGTTYDFPLPRHWIVGFSTIERIEHPAGTTSAYQTPTYLDDGDYTIREGVLGGQPTRVLRFPLTTPESGTENILVTYTTRHVHTDELDTVQPQDLEAVCWLAASWVADARSADEADSSSPTINADVVNYREGVTRWARVASRLRDRFEKHIGADNGVTAAGGFVDWDVSPTYGRDFLFHPRRSR